MVKGIRGSSWAIALVMFFFITIMVRWPWAGGTQNIRSDVRGYWGYLRAVFITHDLGHEKPDGDYVNETPDGTLNKYFCGESVMLLPFFFGAHAVAKTFGYITDGYSLPYQRCIHIAALTYALIGLLCLRALLSRMKVRDGTIALLVFVLGFGTQLLQYTAMQPGWTHAYSFGLVCALLLAMHRMGEHQTPRLLISTGALFGLLALVRPTLGIVLLAFPIVHGDRTVGVLKKLFRQWRMLLPAVLACCAVLSIQSFLWHAQTGHWIENGYRGEGFYWSRPRVFKVLFSIRRGFFVWTPVMIAVVVGVVLLWKSDRIRSVWTLGYFAAITYVISAWWIWYYGGGFGHRAFVDHYPVLLVPFALWYDRAAPLLRRSAFVFLTVASGWHLAQYWQEAHNILHHYAMDSRMYARTFMCFDTTKANELGGNDQEPPYHPNGMRLIADETCDFEHDGSLWQGGKVEERTNVARSGTHVSVLDSATEFSTTLRLPPGTLPSGHHAHLVIDFERYEPRARSSFEALAVLSVERPDGSKRYYEPVRMNPLPGERDAEWEQIHYEIPLPFALLPDDRVLFYIWNRERGEFLLDDLRVQLWSVDPY